jgi:ABC-2 type transport system permease protein
MRTMFAIARREFQGYFATPLAYVFIVAFLAACGAVTFYVGGFFSRRQADLTPFFTFHPWLYLVLIPAVGMRLWAEERRSGTMELLLTLPVRPWQAVIGKFLAAWAFTAITLALTFPIWIIVNYLGEPDNGIIIAGYVGSLLMAGALLAASSCVSALTRNQLIAFVLAIALGFILMMSGLDLVLGAFRGWAPQELVDLIASFSFITHFGTIIRGVVDARAILFFVSLIALFLFINSQIVEAKR